ncbi:hypothetical protein ACFQYP_63120 [Nonomuraea antimicrobica]
MGQVGWAVDLGERGVRGRSGAQSMDQGGQGLIGKPDDVRVHRREAVAELVGLLPVVHRDRDRGAQQDGGDPEAPGEKRAPLRRRHGHYQQGNASEDGCGDRRYEQGLPRRQAPCLTANRYLY